MTRPTWYEQAGCAGLDVELLATGTALEQAEEAKAVCRRCPVITDCLEYAIRSMSAGVWGGVAEDERLRLRRSWQRRARG